jgi:hypothetical protein
MIDGKSSVGVFFRSESYFWDRWSFIFVCIVVIAGFGSLLLDSNFIFLREFVFKDKAAVLLLFSPLIVFLMWFCLVLLPFSNNSISKFFRVLAYLAFFLLFNF